MIRNSDNIIIAVDGPAASGKGTIARRLAQELNLAHMDTGALYRLVGWSVLQEGGNPEDEPTALAAAERLRQIYVPDMNDNPLIRTDAAGQAASQVGQFQGVRDALYHLQVDFAHNPPPGRKGTVLDGRDIGTVIAPDAPVKLFITASTEVRAQRRFAELQKRGIVTSYEDVLEDMRTRDRRDTERTVVPLRPAEDAVLIDTSALDADQAVAKAIEVAKNKLQGP